MARPPKKTTVSEEQRAALEMLRSRPTTPQHLAQRAGMILALADGATALEVASSFGVSRLTVYRWRQRFEAEGPDGLADQARSGRPRRLDDAKVREILRLTVERIPRESTHWSLRLMAKYAGVTEWQVRQVWKAADLKPHRLKTFKLSNDPQFAEKVVDVVGLYLDPPDNAMVLSVDEKSQIQALDRTQPMLPLRPGQVEGAAALLGAALGWVKSAALRKKDTSEMLPPGKAIVGARIWGPLRKSQSTWELGTVTAIGKRGQLQIERMADREKVNLARGKVRFGTLRADTKVLAHCSKGLVNGPAMIDKVIDTGRGDPVAKLTCLDDKGERGAVKRQALLGSLRTKPGWLPPRR